MPKPAMVLLVSAAENTNVTTQRMLLYGEKWKVILYVESAFTQLPMLS